MKAVPPAWSNPRLPKLGSMKCRDRAVHRPAAREAHRVAVEDVGDALRTSRLSNGGLVVFRATYRDPPVGVKKSCLRCLEFERID